MPYILIGFLCLEINLFFQNKCQTAFFFFALSFLDRDLMCLVMLSTDLSQLQLTWNYFKEVATWLVLIGRQLIDLTTLKRNTALRRKTEWETRWGKINWQIGRNYVENKHIRSVWGPSKPSLSPSGRAGCVVLGVCSALDSGLLSNSGR